MGDEACHFIHQFGVCFQLGGKTWVDVRGKCVILLGFHRLEYRMSHVQLALAELALRRGNDGGCRC